MIGKFLFGISSFLEFYSSISKITCINKNIPVIVNKSLSSHHAIAFHFTSLCQWIMYPYMTISGFCLTHSLTKLLGTYIYFLGPQVILISSIGNSMLRQHVRARVRVCVCVWCVCVFVCVCVCVCARAHACLKYSRIPFIQTLVLWNFCCFGS